MTRQGPTTGRRRRTERLLSRRSAGEVVSLVALFLSAVALVVVLDDANLPESYREQAGLLLTGLGGQALPLTAVALATTLALAFTLALVVRGRDRAAARADRLARELGQSRRQIERLQATLKGRDEFLLAVVHELRTPLTHVVGYAELLSGGARPRRPDEIGEMSAAIQSASKTMLRLMDDLAEITHPHDGFRLKPRPIDLVQLINSLVPGFEVHGQRHRLVVSVPNHWLAVVADPERVRQILANLLTNAITYSPNGGEVHVRARAIGNVVRVEVTDQGVGLATADQERIFERFYRGSHGRTLRAHGSGLGLAIVKELAEAHGGQVGVVSAEGKGSTFWFTLATAEELATVPSAARPLIQPVTVGG